MLDVGGGPGYFRDAFSRAGATYYSVDVDSDLADDSGRRGRVVGQRHAAAVPRRRRSTSSTPPTSSSTSPIRGGWPRRCCASSSRVGWPSSATPSGTAPGAVTRPRPGTSSAACAPAGATRRKHGHEPKNRFGECLFAVTVARRHRAGPRGSRRPRWCDLTAALQPALVALPAPHPDPAGGDDVEPRDRAPEALRFRLRRARRCCVVLVALAFSQAPGFLTLRHQVRPRRRPVALPRARRPPVGLQRRHRPAPEPGLRLPVADGPVLRRSVCWPASPAGRSSGCSWRWCCASASAAPPRSLARSGCAPTWRACWPASPTPCRRAC